MLTTKLTSSHHPILHTSHTTNNSNLLTLRPTKQRPQHRLPKRLHRNIQRRVILTLSLIRIKMRHSHRNLPTNPKPKRNRSHTKRLRIRRHTTCLLPTTIHSKPNIHIPTILHAMFPTNKPYRRSSRLIKPSTKKQFNTNRQPINPINRSCHSYLTVLKLLCTTSSSQSTNRPQ